MIYWQELHLLSVRFVLEREENKSSFFFVKLFSILDLVGVWVFGEVPQILVLFAYIPGMDGFICHMQCMFRVGWN